MRKTALLIVCVFLLTSASIAAAQQYDAIVVGSGAGGLGAASTLAQAGKKVLLLEQHERFGGYMTAFERGDYRFEVSLHALDGVGSGGHLHDFLSKTGVLDRVQFKRLDPLYRSLYPDRTLDIPADLHKYQELLFGEFPAERMGIQRLINRIQRVHGQTEWATNLDRGSWAHRFWSYLQAPVRLKDVVTLLNRPFSAVLNEYITDPQAKGVIAQLWGYLGMPPEKLSAIYFAGMWGSYHNNGGYYPVGGSQAISDALARYITEHGGTVRANALVTKILVKDNKVYGVKLADGSEFAAPYVVSNASIPATVEKLVGKEYWPEGYLAGLQKMEISLSIMQIFLGIKDRKVLAPLGGNHSTFVNQGYDPMKAYYRAMDGDVENLDYVMVDYGVHDPGCAPAGGSVLVITVPLQYDFENRWHRDEGYDRYVAFKNEVANKMIARAEKILPGLREQIAVMEIGTPLTMERYTLNPRGAIYGYAMTPEQSILKRPKQKSPIDGLFFAGAWTFPGAGQSACLGSGEITANMILREMQN